MSAWQSKVSYINSQSQGCRKAVKHAKELLWIKTSQKTSCGRCMLPSVSPALPYLTLQACETYLAFSGLVSCSSVQVMVRALRILVHVVDQAWGIRDDHLLVLSACSVPIALSLRCCRSILPQRRRPLLFNNLILHGNCRTNVLLLLSGIPSVITEQGLQTQHWLTAC